MSILPPLQYIGNVQLLRHDALWKRLIEHYEKNQCILEAKDFPSDYIKKRTEHSKKSARRPPTDFLKKMGGGVELERIGWDILSTALQELPIEVREQAYSQPKIPKPS